MADKLPKTDDGVKASALQKIVKSIQTDKAKASEFNGSAGQTTKKALADHGLDRKAFQFVLGLEKQDTQNQQATLRGVIEYAHKMGMFDEVDAFDDMATRMAEIAAEVQARRHNGKPVDSVVDIATGAAKG
jgi:uncharacterized protein (UPF0335 family)